MNRNLSSSMNPFFLNKKQTTPLISNKLDKYFNKLINVKPKIPENKTLPISDNFYSTYIEPNLLLLILLLGLIIFLLLRFYNKYYIEEYENNDNENNNNIRLEKELNKTLKEKNKLIKQIKDVEKYKKKIDDEKNQILSIIDELSSLNYEDSNKINAKIKNLKIQNKTIKQNNDQNNNSLYNNIPEIIDNNDNLNQYSIINNTFEDNQDLIDGVYISPPFIK